MEIELKLTVLDAAVFDELDQTTTLVGYSLRRASSHAIHDRYWDTPRGTLAASGMSFRLRIQDGQPLFTLKAAGSYDAGLFRREELELPATAASWTAVRNEMARYGIELRSGPAESDRPERWLEAAGLEISQDRSSHRRMLIAARDGRDLAELALDTLTYHLGLYDVMFREIEAESRSSGADDVLAIGRALQAAFPGRLRLGDLSKYSRGLELAARLAGVP